MKLHGFRYSPYARKVQLLLDLGGLPYQWIEVPYGDREALAQLTQGYIYVPVLELDDGTALTESRRICQHLLARPELRHLIPPGLEGPQWAFHDFVDAVVEDKLFRVASPPVRDAWPTAWERALYTLVKERRYGAGCVDAWKKDTDALLSQGREVLAPTLQTLEQRPFVFGEALSFADVALYGQWRMLEEAEWTLLPRLSPLAVQHARRVEAQRPAERGPRSGSR